MNRFVTLVLVCLIILCFSALVHAQQGIALTVKVSTLGMELGAARVIAPRFNGKLGLGLFSYGKSGETEGDDPIAYDADLKLFSVSALVDYQPFENWFRLSGGLLYNANKVDGTGKVVETYEIDARRYTPDDIGIFTMKAEPSTKLEPYIGIGVGNPVAANKRWGFLCDIGVLYQGSPEVTLEADEDARIYPTTEQEGDVEEDIKGLKWYPVIGLGASYQF